jgi:hypothetical protein
MLLQLDQGGWHRAKRLRMPDNIILMFQLPHCPECNPIESNPAGLEGSDQTRLITALVT